MNNQLSSAELVAVNEVIRSTLILTQGHPPERRAMMAVHAAAQITGVTMAVESFGSRARTTIDLLDIRTRTAFEEVKVRAYIHAFDEKVNGRRSVGDVFRHQWGEGPISKGDAAQRALLELP